MLSAVAGALSQQLRMDEESLEFFLCDTVVETLAPATRSLTQKDRFAARVPQHQPPTLALPAAQGAEEELERSGEGGVWFLKRVQSVGFGRGVTVHPTLAAAVGAAAPESYVVTPAVPRPWLWDGRKCHFRVYLLAYSPPSPEGVHAAAAARLRPARAVVECFLDA